MASLNVVVLAVLVLSAAAASQTDNTAILAEFRLWKARFHKAYKNTADEDARFTIWRKNKVIVDGVNGSSNSSWTGKCMNE